MTDYLEDEVEHFLLVLWDDRLSDGGWRDCPSSPGGLSEGHSNNREKHRDDMCERGFVVRDDEFSNDIIEERLKVALVDADRLEENAQYFLRAHVE